MAEKGSWPQILNIHNKEDVSRAVELILQGFPIALGVMGRSGRIYGFGGCAEAFFNPPDRASSIAYLKTWQRGERNFFIKPPVCAASEETIKTDVDLKSEEMRLAGIIFDNVGAHLVLPLKKETEDKYPFALALGNERKSQAFMLVKKPPLEQLVRQVENRDRRLFVTSANRAGEHIYSTAEQVAKTFGPELPLILAEAENELLEDGGQSSAMYELFCYPDERIGVLRLTSDSTHQRMVQTIIDSGVCWKFDFSTLTTILG